MVTVTLRHSSSVGICSSLNSLFRNPVAAMRAKLVLVLVHGIRVNYPIVLANHAVVASIIDSHLSVSLGDNNSVQGGKIARPTGPPVSMSYRMISGP